MSVPPKVHSVFRHQEHRTQCLFTVTLRLNAAIVTRHHVGSDLQALRYQSRCRNQSILSCDKIEISRFTSRPVAAAT